MVSLSVIIKRLLTYLLKLAWPISSILSTDGNTRRTWHMPSSQQNCLVLSVSVWAVWTEFANSVDKLCHLLTQVCTAFVSCRHICSIVRLHSAFCVVNNFDDDLRLSATENFETVLSTPVSKRGQDNWKQSWLVANSVYTANKTKEDSVVLFVSLELYNTNLTYNYN